MSLQRDRDDSPWKTRQVVTTTSLLWKTLDVAMDAIVWAHYRLKRHGATMRPATYQALSDTLRYVKGIAVFWERWLQVTYPPPPPTSVPVPAPQPSPNDSENTPSAGHASASPVEHERG